MVFVISCLNTTWLIAHCFLDKVQDFSTNGLQSPVWSDVHPPFSSLHKDPWLSCSFSSATLPFLIFMNMQDPFFLSPSLHISCSFHLECPSPYHTWLILIHALSFHISYCITKAFSSPMPSVKIGARAQT